VTVTSMSGSALISVRADSPDHARLLASALVAQVANASARDLADRTKAELADNKHMLSTTPAGDERRAALLRAREQLEQDAARTRFGLAMGPRPAAPLPAGAVDRMLSWLPGPLPPRPSLLWVALVGLAASAVVSAVAVTRSRLPSDEPWLGAWLLPLSPEERADLLSFSRKFGRNQEEALALELVSSKERDARQWQDIVEEFVQRFPPTRKRHRVLLFGCGAGDEAVLLADAGYELCLADADPMVLEFVQHRLRRRDLSAKSALVDPRRPAVDGVYDAIFASQLSCAGLDRSLAAQALRGALRPGAMLVEKRPRLAQAGRSGPSRLARATAGRLAS
jgi:hypothetical protein